jgi:hypothetical protein
MLLSSRRKRRVRILWRRELFVVVANEVSGAAAGEIDMIDDGTAMVSVVRQ